MSKIVKRVTKKVGKAFSKVGKGFKKFFASKFGKVVLAAVAIYTAGAAAGLWASPWAATTTTAAGMSEAALATEAMVPALEVSGLGTAASEAMLADVAAGAASAGAQSGSGAAALQTQQAGSGVLASEQAMAADAMVPALDVGGAGAQAKAGFLGEAAQAAKTVEAAGTATTFAEKVGTAAKTIGSFIEKNPMASALAAQTVAGAFSADDVDLAREQARQERELMEERRRRFELGAVTPFQHGTQQRLPTPAPNRITAGPNRVTQPVRQGILARGGRI